MSDRSGWQVVGRFTVALVAVGVLALQGGVAWGATWVLENEKYLKDQLIAKQFEPAEDVIRYVEDAGLSDLGELYLMASLTKVVPAVEFDRYCTRSEPGIGVLGCYNLRDQRIYLYDVTDPRLTSMEPVVAAHEMLHAAWDRLTLQDQQRLAVLLEEGFAMLPTDHELRSRIQNYEQSNPASRIPELYAILGTEISDLPAELEAHYRQYFDDRMKSVYLAQEFYAVFDLLVGERDTLVSNLESQAAEIEGLKFTYEDTSAVLRQDVLAFNERANTAGGFPSRSEFEATRATLLERQSRLEELRIVLMEKIDAYNALLDELTRLNTELSELNRGVNITLEAQEELEADGALVQDQ